MNKNNADVKLSLIDLEASNIVTGGKQFNNNVQPERLSEKDNMYSVYWIHLPEQNDIYTQGYVGITSNYKNRMKSYAKKKGKNNHFGNAINKYGWNNLLKEIIHNNITLKKALKFEEFYRPIQNIGWNSQKGGILGVEKEWYTIPENKLKHKENTSKATRIGISLKDTPSKRSLRAKENWLINYKSYENKFSGSNNPKAILNEEQVKCIKCELIPKGLTNKEIGNLYKVKNHVIQFIRNNKNWKHIICDSPDHKQVD